MVGVQKIAEVGHLIVMKDTAAAEHCLDNPEQMVEDSFLIENLDCMYFEEVVLAMAVVDSLVGDLNYHIDLAAVADLLAENFAEMYSKGDILVDLAVAVHIQQEVDLH